MMSDHTTLFHHRAYIDDKMVDGSMTWQGFIVRATGELVKIDSKLVSIRTGTKDRKGDFVYTGDVMDGYTRSMKAGIVRYLGNGGGFVLTGVDGTNVHLAAGYCSRCRIKGNIYTSRYARKILKQFIESEKAKHDDKS